MGGGGERIGLKDKLSEALQYYSALGPTMGTTPPLGPAQMPTTLLHP